MLRKERISNKVWVIYGEEQPDVARGFVRFQEYYENALLKGKRGLVYQDIEKWWQEHRDKEETELYYTYWTGFNVPGKVILDLVRSHNFRSVSGGWHPEETEFLKLLEDIPVEDILESYFIGMWQGSEDVLEHEIAHAFFSTIPGYKAEQTLNLAEFPSELYKDMQTKLIAMGYHSDVVQDEMQAYLSSYTENLPEIFDTDTYNDYCHSFVETLQRYRALNTPS